MYRIKVKSTDCTQQREQNSGTNKCVSVNNNSLQNSRSSGPSSRFSVWDILSEVNNNSNNNEITSEQSTNQLRIPVDCFCNKSVNFLTPISFHLIGGQATLNFTIENMRPTDDFNDFMFEAFYEFLSTSSNDYLTQQTFVPLETHPRNVQLKTNPPKNYSLTTYSLTVPSNYSFDYYQEFKQRKHLIAKPNENVLINVPNGFLWKNSVLRTCSQMHRLIIYWILPSNLNQFNSIAQKSSTDSNNNAVATICIEPYRGDQEADNKLEALNLDQIQLSFELNEKSDQPSNSRTLKFYANNTVKQIDLVIELIATSKGQFRFDWLESLNKQEFHSSMRTSEPKGSNKSNDNGNKLSSDNNLNFNTNSNNNDNGNNNASHQCLAYCPEDGLCLRQENLCDQIPHCSTSAWDESFYICDAKEKNILEHFLSVQTENKIDKITLNDSILKSNWFIVLSLLAVTLFTLLLAAYLVVYFKRRNKHSQSMTSSNFPTHLQIGSLNNNTIGHGSASSTFSGNSSLTNSSCTNSMLCDKKFKKMKQKMMNKEQLKQQKHLQSKLQQPSNALTLIRSSLEASDNNFNQLLIPSYGNSNSTIIHQQLHQQPKKINQLNSQPADYVSTSEFQFELNQDRLTNYEKQNDFSLLYKKQDQDEYSLKQQHIYYQPAYTTLQRNNRDGNKNLEYCLDNNQRIDFRIDRRMDQNSLIDKPPLPPLPSVLQQNQQLLSYHPSNSNDESHHQEMFNQTFGLRSQLNSHLTSLNNHHTIARQSLLQDSSTQAERLLMNTPIYEVADRQFNNSSTMHRSALLRAGRRFS